jgi:flagellar basal-body rod modification protein FlgD
MDTTSITGGGIGSGGRTVLSAAGGRYGNNPFLDLLVTQLRNQTPLEPVDNSSFMNQMAQYSSMTEQKQLNDNLLRLLDYQGALARLQGLSEGSALLGKEITFVVDGGKKETGVVESVFVDDQGEVKMRVGEKEVALRQVTGIRTRQVED